MKTDCKKPMYIEKFNMEEVSVRGFCGFCGNNMPLILAISIMLFFTYGVRLFWYSVGIDTNLFMADKSAIWIWYVRCGRFGLPLLSKLWHIKEFNPFTANYAAFCLVWLFTVSWCYIIAIFSKNTGRNNKLIPFAIVFMTSPVWAEMHYFSLMATETCLIICLCPYVIYYLYKGFLNDNKGKIICASIVLIFMISVYQAIVPLFCCGVFVCFVLLQERSDYEPRVYRNLCLKFFITLVSAILVYSIIDRIIFPNIFHIEKSDYVDSMNKWGQIPIKQNISAILEFCYKITLKHCTRLIVGPIVAIYARSGMQAAEYYANLPNIFRVSQNVMLLPVTVFFLIKIITVMNKTIPSKRKPLYVLAGIGIPLCIVFLTVMGGNSPPLRALYALPLAFAFMFFYLIESYKNKIAVVIACFALFTAVYQAEITAQLFYSDYMRYNEDVRFAYELDKLITPVQPKHEKLPVTLIGKYKTASRFHDNFLQGEVIGHSFFEWDSPEPPRPSNATNYGLRFMKTIGIYYDSPNDAQLERALEEAVLMPAYPDSGCVKRMDDFIVVRISDTLFW